MCERSLSPLCACLKNKARAKKALDIKQVSALVQGHARVRVVGLGHSFNHFCSDDLMISTTQLNKVGRQIIMMTFRWPSPALGDVCFMCVYLWSIYHYPLFFICAYLWTYLPPSFLYTYICRYCS